MTSTIVLPRESHTHTIIWLHGRDSYAEEFSSELFESEASQPEGQPMTLPDLFPTIKWVFPQAPLLRAERFDVEKMPQWFDMWSVENPHERPEFQEDGLRDSIAQILDIIREEAISIPTHKIFLAGISQGFATTISTFFVDGNTQFAGLIGLSSWIPPFAAYLSIMPIYHLAGKTPVFLAHSLDDDVVPIGNGEHLRDTLSAHMETIEWKQYEEGGHWINEPEGVNDIVRFLRVNM
ncbi:lysophospholipase II [Hypoxylon trugodes]|uniref:lysophospholipase II n=1 Tax=Hypoxylon trugodes TaxID=326681 RepID=UPI0021A1FA5D|nr:lysophospholipase II [Hypoxylon trugodes]KAI1387842.1 lysophospholipase II [Hypoxylon trugodes]